MTTGLPFATALTATYGRTGRGPVNAVPSNLPFLLAVATRYEGASIVKFAARRAPESGKGRAPERDLVLCTVHAAPDNITATKRLALPTNQIVAQVATTSEVTPGKA